MGPAVTLEKSSIGAKRYLPLPQAMPRLAQSARRHSGSTSGYQTIDGDLRKPQVMRNLKRQWSSDCVLGRGDLDVSIEDGSSFFGDVSEIRHCPLALPKDFSGCSPKSRVLSCKNVRREGFGSCRVERSTAFDWTEQAEGVATCTTNKFHLKTNAISPSTEASRTATTVNRRHWSEHPSPTFRDEESTTTAVARPAASDSSPEAGNTILELEANNDKLMQRVSALLRRVRHLYKKGIHLNLEKYHQQLQMTLQREGMTLKSSTQPAPRPSEIIDSRTSESSSSLNLSCVNLDESKSIGEESFSSRSFDRKDSSALRRNISDVVRKLERSLDPDATDESCSDRESNPESDRQCGLGNVDAKSLPEQDWIADRAVLSSEWRRLDQKLRLVDEEIGTAKIGLRKLQTHKTRNEDVGWWTVTTLPGTSKLVFSRTAASRCVPFDWSKRRKRISTGGRTADSCDRCASRGCSSPSTGNEKINEDPYKLSEVIWKRWSSASVDQKGFQSQESKSSDLPHLSCDFSSSDFCHVDVDNFFDKSKSVAQAQNLLGNRSRREAAKSSTARIGSETCKKSSYDINDVILLPTNSSSTRLDAFVKKKDIDVPTWRYVACNQLDQESELEDTSDYAYVRRHLEPEITERRHRVPEFISKGRRRDHSKGPFSNLARRRRNFRRQNIRSSFDGDVFTDESKSSHPNCHGDGGYGKREPSEAFEWSSVSRHSDDTSGFHVDDKSLDGASWVSATNACNSSDLSADYNLPRGVCRVEWTCGEGDRPERLGTSIDSCSTASACSPLNSDLQL